MDVGVSTFDLHSRAAKFEAQSARQREREAQKLEKERILHERAHARREAHERAIDELRRRQAEEAERVRSCRFDVF